MAISKDQFSDALQQAGGANSHGLKMLMLNSGLFAPFKDPANWAQLCEFAVEVDDEHHISEDFQQGFADGASLESALNDNYILGAIAAVKLGLHRGRPVMAWSAFNKHSYPGLALGEVSETACMRFLQWAGADVSAAEENTKMTPLHYMAHVRHGRGTHPEAVRWLLDCGADPQAKNKNGDTPMAYMCGMQGWNDAQRQTFLMLLQAGCDPMEASNDGTTPLGLLQLAQEACFDERRQALIDALKSDISRPKPGFFTKLVGAGKSSRWASSLAH